MINPKEQLLYRLGDNSSGPVAQSFRDTESSKGLTNPGISTPIKLPHSTVETTLNPTTVRGLHMNIVPHNVAGEQDPTLKIFQITEGMTTIGEIADNIDGIRADGDNTVRQWLNNVDAGLDDLLRAGNIRGIITACNTFLAHGNIIDGNHRALGLALIKDEAPQLKSTQLDHSLFWFLTINMLSFSRGIRDNPPETVNLAKARW